MKYDIELSELLKLLPSAKNILIALPSQPNIDMLSSGLALFLSLKQAGKEASIVTEGVIRVGHTNLFGVGQIQNKLPQVSGGDFVITLGGVVDPQTGIVPALKNLDWAPSGPDKKDLKLTFHILPGQKFEPSFITPVFEGGNFDLIFVLGALDLNSLGSIYSRNPEVFARTQLVNINNKQGSSQFGTIAIIDSIPSSLSEIVIRMLPALGLPLDQDMATNILAGIFASTANLQNEKVNTDTYEAVVLAMRAGGQKPVLTMPNIATTGLPSEALAKEGFDLSKIFGTAPVLGDESFTVPKVVGSASNTELESQPPQMEPPQPSPEEMPLGEGVAAPENDWLTPKIFRGKGSSLG